MHQASEGSRKSSSKPTRKANSSSEASLPEVLQEMRDEIRLQIHLAGMEAKQTFSGLEAQLEHALRNAENTGEAASKFVSDTRENARGALEDLRVRFELLRESLKDATGR